MSKELDYLDKILNYQPLTLVERTIIECIKEKIQRLEAIDNPNPSEALEELEQDIKNRVILAEDRQLKLCAIIKQALLKSQEQEKVLEIIKEKVMSLVSIEDGRVWDNELYGSNDLTQEEFELLKRYFEWKHQ